MWRPETGSRLNDRPAASGGLAAWILGESVAQSRDGAGAMTSRTGPRTARLHGTAGGRGVVVAGINIPGTASGCTDRGAAPRRIVAARLIGANRGACGDCCPRAAGHRRDDTAVLTKRINGYRVTQHTPQCRVGRLVEEHLGLVATDARGKLSRRASRGQQLWDKSAWLKRLANHAAL
jgi:hypothetical protein